MIAYGYLTLCVGFYTCTLNHSCTKVDMKNLSYQKLQYSLIVNNGKRLIILAESSIIDV